MNWLQWIVALVPALTTIGVVFLQTGKLLNRMTNLETGMDKLEIRLDKLELRMDKFEKRFNKLVIQVAKIRIRSIQR